MNRSKKWYYKIVLSKYDKGLRKNKLPQYYQINIILWYSLKDLFNFPPLFHALDALKTQTEW